MKGAEDVAIIRKAKKEKRIIITNDKEFGWLVTVYKPPGLILLRLKRETVDARLKTIENIINKHQDLIYCNIIIATEKKVRIRPL